MKEFLIALFFCLSIGNTFAHNTNPEHILLENKEICVSTTEESKLFYSIAFNKSTDNLEYLSIKNIDVIQIFNSDDEMEFILPVLSKKVVINKNLFGKGQFKIGFLISGHSELYYSRIVIK